MPFKNPEKRKEYNQEYHKNYYLNNKALYKQSKDKYGASIVKWFNEYKSSLVCTQCGETHIACLDFNHVDSSTKDFSVSTMVNHGLSITRIKNEISKCIVLCSNCHRKLHWNERT